MTGRGSFPQTPPHARIRTENMASRSPFVSEELRSALEVRIRGLTSADMREICKDYGVDDSGTLQALQQECISLLDEMTSTRDDSGIDEFKTRIFRLKHAPLLDFPQRHTGLQQFSGVTALDSSRFHAGNSYVEHQNNYYAPTTPTPQAPNDEYPERELRAHNRPALLAALEFPQMNLRRMNIEMEFPGTCTWLESTEEYKRWRERRKDDGNCMLWIKGIPGAGKSMIMKHAYRKESESPYHYTPIAFFFNANGCDLAKSAEGMFRTLLHQLVSQTSSGWGLPDMMNRSELKYFKKQGWPLALLKTLFRQAALFRVNVYTRPIVSYIDALDECAEDEVRELLAFFEDLAEEMDFPYRPRMCFSSRPYPNITINRCEVISLDRRPEHENDIRKYVLSRLSAGHLDESESNHRRGLISEIIEKSSGVFLWVVLVTAQLRKSADHGVHPGMLREHLLTIPPALHDLFDTMINQEDTNECLLPIVQWVLFAQGRLRAIDLYFAVKFSTGSLQEVTANSDWESFDETWLRNFILTSSKGILKTIDTESNSYMPCEFIHESVREYFLEGGLRKLDTSLGGDVVAASHARLARTCQNYLDNQISQQRLESVSLHPMGTTDNSDALDPTPMLAYIRDRGAFLHAEIADRNGIPQTDFCNNFAFDNWLWLLQYPKYEPGGRVSLQLERARTMRENDATLLHVLVDNQMESLVQRELQFRATDDAWTLEHHINAQCGGLGTALHIAVERNNTAIIRALVTSGAHVDFRCETIGTPLDYAMLLQQTESVAVLLQLGATPTSGLSPHQRRKILDIRDGRGPRREGSGHGGGLGYLPIV